VSLRNILPGVLLLASVVFTLAHVASVAAIEPPLYDPGYDHLSDLNDKMQHAHDAQVHVPAWLLVLVGITMVGLMVRTLHSAWSQSRRDLK
jgi:hypothetical protein